jgi:hypothetical protein
MFRPLSALAASVVLLAAATAARATLFAQYYPGPSDQGTYVQGSLPGAFIGNYTDPTILGNTPQGVAGLPEGYPGVVSVFNPPWDTEPAAQIVVIGAGGGVELQFPQPVTSANNFEVGVFSNVGLEDVNFENYPNAETGGQPAGGGLPAVPPPYFGGGQAVVSVSQDGNNWVNLGLQTFDIPENFYLNAGPYDATAPADPELADFGDPFNGTLNDFIDENNDQVIATLNGSAGGTWLNLSSAGLSQINFIQFYEDPNQVAPGSYLALEAVSVADPADVPEPASTAILVAGSALLLRRRARGA